MSILEALDTAIDAADHISGEDAGAVEAARALARKIDAWDQIVEWANDDAAESGSRPKVPANDNTSLPTFLKYCDALGLTPAGRKNLDLSEGVEVNPVDQLKQKRRQKERKAG